jgi:hypothetical protein
LVARAHAETDRVVQDELFNQLKEVIQIFLAEFRRSLPELAEEERVMRLLFVAGSMVQTMLLPLKPVLFQMFFGGSDSEVLFENLIQFCSEGLKAPSLQMTGGAE